MADFFDKVIVGINKGVNSVSEGSKNMVEKAKIHSAVSDAEKAKLKLMEQLGALTYAAQQSGMELPENLLAVCGQITAQNNQIQELQQRLADMEAAKAAATAASAAPAAPAGPVCSACGAVGRPGGKFCAKCGGSLQ